MTGTVLGLGDLAGNDSISAYINFYTGYNLWNLFYNQILSNIFIDNLEEQIFYMLQSGTEDIKDKGELKLVSRIRSGNIKGI